MTNDRRDDIDYINDHRLALDREPIPPDTPPEEVDRLLALIDARAPYGEDPFAGEDVTD